MTKHTPGPWKHYTAPLRPQFPTIIHEIQDADGEAIVKWGGFDGVDQPKRTVIANARLIAAAPDLLAFAETVVTLFAVAYPKSGLHLDMDKASLLNAAREVIKKARG